MTANGDDSSSGSDIPGLSEFKRELYMASGSPFLPPPNYFMPSAPPPSRY